MSPVFIRLRKYKFLRCLNLQLMRVIIKKKMKIEIERKSVIRSEKRWAENKQKSKISPECHYLSPDVTKIYKCRLISNMERKIAIEDLMSKT